MLEEDEVLEVLEMLDQVGVIGGGAGGDRVAVRVIVPGKARGKQRHRTLQTRKGVRHYTPSETVNAEAWVRHCYVDQVGKTFFKGAMRLEMVVRVEPPASWSNKKRAAALSGEIRPTTKPDADNALKLFQDALNGVAWADDVQIVSVAVEKVYDEWPEIEARVIPLYEKDILDLVCEG